MVTSQFLYRDRMGWGLCLARGSWSDECDHIPGGQGSVLLHSSRPTCSFLTTPPNFFHLRRRSSIILSQGIPQNFAVQRPKRLHLASSLQLGWVRNIGRFCRGHGSEGGLGVICRKKIQTGRKRAIALEPSLPRLSI